MKKVMKRYVLGNWLRGYFAGRFSSDVDAWNYLSRRFLLSYPSRGGRSVSMWGEETHYKHRQLILMREGVTWCGTLPRQSVLRRCKRNPYWISPA